MKQDNKQDLKINTIETEVKHINSRLVSIEHKLSNDIPHKIEKLNEKIDGITSKLFYGFVFMIAATLLLQILLRFFK